MPTVFGWTWQRNYRCLLWNSFLRHLLIVMGVPIASFVLSNLVIANFTQPSVSLQCFCVSLPLDFEVALSMRQPSLSQITNNNSNSVSTVVRSPRSRSHSRLRRVHLSAVLADNDSFRAFMAHLFGEFSYENALCLIECLKFRERIIALTAESPPPPSVICGRDQINSDQWCSDIRECRSSAVAELLQSTEDARMVAYHLFDRYIAEDAPFRLNLSYHLRTNVRQSMSDIGSSIPSTLFDPVIQQCFRWLRQSLDRFENSADFPLGSVDYRRRSQIPHT